MDLHKGFSAPERAVVAKAMKRLVPFMALLYFVSFLDRVNVGFAALTMNQDIGLSASAYGFGAGIFFIGYFLFEIPSNLILKRVGARVWITRIMVTWGILSIAMAFATGPVSFWVLRFLLGVAEAGFFPGMILYLTFWFPAALRGRVMSGFLIAVPLSSALGAPFSTFLLETSIFSLKGWQTMFVLEGLPALLLGVAVFFLLPDSPRTAKWLTKDEQDTLENLLEKDNEGSRHSSLKEGLLNPNVWRFSFIYLGLVIGLYGFSFWSPQIIKTFGDLSNFQVGLISMIPYACSAIAMYWWGKRSDEKGERIFHLAFPAFLGGAAFLVSTLSSDPVFMLVAFTFGAIGIYAALPVFWTLPTALLTGTAAAGGIALINSIGNLGGYIGPVLVGYLRGRMDDYVGGMLVLAAALIIAGLLTLSCKRKNAKSALKKSDVHS